MSDLDDIIQRVINLEAIVVELRAMLKTLEAGSSSHTPQSAAPTNPHRKKRKVQPIVRDRVIDARQNQWAEFVLLFTRFGPPHQSTDARMRKQEFAIRHHLNPAEFYRWFACHPKKQIQEGSVPDRNIRVALTAEIGALKEKAQHELTCDKGSHSSA